MKKLLIFAGSVMSLILISAIVWYITSYIPQRDQKRLEYEQLQDAQASADKEQKLELEQQAQVAKAQQDCTKNATEAIKSDAQYVSSSVTQTAYDSQFKTCYALYSKVTVLPAIKMSSISTTIMDVDTRQTVASCATFYGNNPIPLNCGINNKHATLQEFNDYKISIFGE